MEATMMRKVRLLQLVPAFFAGMFCMGVLATGYLAYAQGEAVATSGGVDMKSILSGLLLTLLTTFAGLIAKVGTKAIEKFGNAADKWITDHVQNDVLERAILTVKNNAMTVATNLWQTEVKYMIQEALKDGKIDAEELAAIKAKAMEQLGQITPKNVMASLSAAGVDTKTLASAAIEEAVHALKDRGKALKIAGGISPKA